MPDGRRHGRRLPSPLTIAILSPVIARRHARPRRRPHPRVRDVSPGIGTGITGNGTTEHRRVEAAGTGISVLMGHGTSESKFTSATTEETSHPLSAPLSAEEDPNDRVLLFSFCWHVCPRLPISILNVMTARILIVDDEEWVCTLVGRYLEQAGYQVATAVNGTEALTKFASFHPDLIVLDWMLPGIDGIEVARRIRAQSTVPIIMLTARVDEEDRITGLEIGADDYVVKPFSARELEARVRAILRRRSEGSDQSILESGEIKLDLKQRIVKIAGRLITDLTPMEFDLLAFFLRYPGQAFTRLELLEAIRGTTYASFERAIDSHIKRLRRKIEPDPQHPRYILTVFGVGYKLAKENEKP